MKVENQIVSYVHCAECLNELPKGSSPMEYARTQTGLTVDGSIQVWCNRHDMNVALINEKTISKLREQCCPICENGGHQLCI